MDPFESDKTMGGGIGSNDRGIRTAVIRALRYYSSFYVPLKAEEIYHNLPSGSSLSRLLVVLEDLTENGEIFKYNGYYSLDPAVKQLVVKRKVSYN